MFEVKSSGGGILELLGFKTAIFLDRLAVPLGSTKMLLSTLPGYRNCLPRVQPLNCWGPEKKKEWWRVLWILDNYTRLMILHEISKLGPPIPQATLALTSSEWTLSSLSSQESGSSVYLWLCGSGVPVGWLYQRSIYGRPAGDPKTVIFREKVICRNIDGCCSYLISP